MAKDPAWPCYAQDFDMDTATWENDEVGMFFRLLNYEWINGSIPPDLKKMAKICREKRKKFEKKFSVFGSKFVPNINGNLINLRMEEERRKRQEYIKKQSDKGKLSAEKRATTVITTVEPEFQPEGQPEVNSSSSSSSSIKKKPPISPKGYTTDFESFWEAYPKKIGKGEAFKTWNKNSHPSLEIILLAIEKQKESKQWKKENGQYIPNPTTWLNQGRWDDEIEPEKSKTIWPQPPILKPPDNRPDLTAEQIQKNKEFLRNLSNSIGKPVK